MVAANSAWTEEAITHSNAPVTSNDPGTGLPYATTAFTTISVNDYYTFDVTELVRDWLDGTKTNHGIVLMAAAATPSVSVTFISKEAASKGHQPTLHIVLAGPQGPTGATGLTG